jgi:glycosyltransferase involved in cell wall biosynthesis
MTAPTAQRRVLIVDSGMRSLGGHNFTYTQSVRRAFEERGFAVDVLVNRGLGSDVAEAHRLHPVFSCGAYDHPLGHGRFRDLAYLYAQSRVFAEELDHGLRCVLREPPALIFCHTVADFELVGWAREAARLRLEGALAIVLRQTPGFGTCGFLRRTLNPYWRLRPRAFERLQARLGRRFLLCTDSEPLSEDYARVHGGHVLTLPIPLDRALFTPQGGRTEGVSTRYGLEDASRLRVGYLGDARASKGFPLLPAVARRLPRSKVPARLVVQCPRPNSGDDHKAAPAGLDELRELAEESADVTLIPERLTPEDYADLVQHLDVVLLPYLHPSYAEATSGIFAEALALGKPVVVSSGTWMARELGRAGSGVVFPRETPESLPDRVLELLADYPRHAAAAAASQAAWREFHSPESLASLLLSELGLATACRSQNE